MESFFGRAAEAVAALSSDDEGAFVTVEEIHDEMARRWPASFPRPHRVVDTWCREAVERGRLVSGEHPSAGASRRDWRSRRYALAPGAELDDETP